jgi:hypothetical protein
MRRRRFSTFARFAWPVVPALGALAFACISPVDSPNSKVPGKCELEAPKIGSQKTDILFVIDNSGSMAEEQEGIARELPAFIQTLQSAPVKQDFQVGVITTSVYQNANRGGPLEYSEYADQMGKLRAVPQADGGVGTEKVLKGDDAALVDKFARLVKQGISGGSGQETPFEAVRLATSAPLTTTALDQGGNQGFFRDGARLLVVVVSDEDDCSEQTRPVQVYIGTSTSTDYCTNQSSKLTPVTTYRDLFRDLKDGTGALRPFLWASIAPVAVGTKVAQATLVNGVVRNVDCPTSFQPGFRHREMASYFDSDLNNLDSICNPSYRDSLLAIASLAITDQSVEVSDNVPDARLLKVELERTDGTKEACTTLNGGIRFEEGTATRKPRIHFQGSCVRRVDDKSIAIQMLCAS